MGLIDFITNVAGVLLWVNWRSLRFDPLAKTSAASLIGTLRRAEPQRVKGWQLLAVVVLLLVLRALLYWQIGAAANWVPKLNLMMVVLAFRNGGHHLSDFLVVLLYSTLSFVRALVVFYFWLLSLSLLGQGGVEGDPIQKLLRQHLGRVSRWPWPVQAIVPLVLTACLWAAVHGLLLRAGVTNRVSSSAHLFEQGLLAGLGLYFSLKYLLPPWLFVYLIASYVYLGNSPVWDFLCSTSRNLLAPLERVPLQFGKCDFSPLVGAVLLLLLLHWLPGFVLAEMAAKRLSFWPL
jgi:uncharacterized protein YggT (Ycf19 family)